MTIAVTVVALWLGAAAALLTPVVYATGNRWWSTYWGRTLMLKDAVIALAYLKSLAGLFGHRLPRSVSWDTWSISAAMAVALLANLVVMVVVTKRGQRRARAE
jgi:hypothetical protein